MSKHKVPALTGEILDQATTWFVEFSEGEVSQAAREDFIKWLRTSPEHVRAYLQVTAHWEEARTLSKVSVPSIDELVALARESPKANVISIGGGRPSAGQEQPGSTVNSTPERRPATPMRNHRLRRFFIAASIAITMLGASAMYWFDSQRGVYSTDIGEQRSIRLEDGSTVELNARSKIRVALHERQRDVELIEGQALFRVAKDHARPFIVHSGDTNVLAVGTQFDVYKHHGDTTVTVVEGRVAVFPATPPTKGQAPTPAVPAVSEALQAKAPESNHRIPRAKSEPPGQGSAEIAGLPESHGIAGPKGEIFLGAGEQVTVSSKSLGITEHADVAAATAWIQKQIVFNSTPLSQVVDEFNRYNTRQLVITDPRISDTKISGEFSSSNPDSLLRGLDALRKFNIHETPDRIEISGK